MEEPLVNLSSRHQQLLRDLKSTVESLLCGQVTNVWSVYGGLNRLHRALEKIFKLGCKEVGEKVRSIFGYSHICNSF